MSLGTDIAYQAAVKQELLEKAKGRIGHRLSCCTFSVRWLQVT